MHTVPCSDSEAEAEALRRRLLVPRDVATRLGREALAVCTAGGYVAPSSRWVDLRDAITASIKGKRSIPPGEALTAGRPARGETRVHVVQASSMDAAQRLRAAHPRVLVLNFANGTTPGGGFLHGSRAQEECLARSSALVPTLDGDPMYDAHRRGFEYDATPWAILSPDVPFFRDESGPLLESPWTASVLTCAAPRADVIGQARSMVLMRERIGRVLDIAHAEAFDALVLGAWGCGAFHNDPATVASLFHQALRERDGWFSEVVFAIADWAPQRHTLGPFRDAFEESSGA